MTALDPLYKLYFRDGTSFQVSSNLNKLMKELENFGEEEAYGYLSYLSDVYGRYIIAKKHFLDVSYRRKRDFFNLKTPYHGYRLKTLNNAYDSISRFVKNEKLRQALSFQTLYVGVSPFQGPSIYTIIPMIELLYGIHYIKGGMYQMAAAMEKRFLELGGKIHFNQSVDEIMIKDQIAQGVRIKDDIKEADIILTNADFPWAVENLIKERKNRGKYKDKKLKKMTYSSSVFIMYMGLDKKYQTYIHSLRFAADFKKNINDLFE